MRIGILNSNLMTPVERYRFDYLNNPDPLSHRLKSFSESFQSKLLNSVFGLLESDDVDVLSSSRSGSNSSGGTTGIGPSQGFFDHKKGRPGGYDNPFSSHYGDSDAPTTFNTPRKDTEDPTRPQHDGSVPGSDVREDSGPGSWLKGLFDNTIFSGSGPLAGLGNLLSSLAGYFLRTNLTGAEREANAFTAQQAELNRNFQSAEADKAREWQEQQYLQYNSPAALVRQYSEAGINPVMIAGGNMPAASTSTAAPAGNAGSSVAPVSGIDLVSAIIQILKSKEELKGLQLGNKERETDIETKTLNNDILREFGKLQASASYEKLLAEIDQLTESANTSRYERQVLGPLKQALMSSETAKNDAESLLLAWRQKYIEVYGTDPDSPALTQLLNMLGTLIDRIQGRYHIGGKGHGL